MKTSANKKGITSAQHLSLNIFLSAVALFIVFIIFSAYNSRGKKSSENAPDQITNKCPYCDRDFDITIAVQKKKIEE